MMIDDLDFAFDEHDDRGRHRRGRAPQRSSKKKKKKKKGRSVFALLLTFLLLGGLGLGGYIGYKEFTERFTTPDYAGQGLEETAQVEIKTGATQADIANALHKADVIKSPKAFVEAGLRNEDALKIQPGFYKLRKQMSGDAAVTALLDPKNRVVNGVTIQEGLITLEIFALLSKELNIPVEDFKKAAEDPVKLGVPDWWFTRKDGKPVIKSIEGFLFPATYEFAPKETAESALKKMVNKFNTVVGQLKFADRAQNERKISPLEALITASIVEAEVNKADDMPKTSRAIYNRVYNNDLWQRGMEVDAAFNYKFKLDGKDPKHSNELLRSELNNASNPYNTYRNKGLTPTPIGNPGESALKAAIDPAVGKFIYWVAVDQQGTTLFAETDSQHCANINIGIKNGFLASSARC